MERDLQLLGQGKRRVSSLERSHRVSCRATSLVHNLENNTKGETREWLTVVFLLENLYDLIFDECELVSALAGKVVESFVGVLFGGRRSRWRRRWCSSY